MNEQITGNGKGDMKTVAIITARSKSTRLPNKVLADICGKPMLLHIVERVRQAKLVDQVVVATVQGDFKVILFCLENNIDYYAGSENDILDRLYQTARKFEAEIIVRIWGDSPLICPEGIDDAISQHKIRIPYTCREQAGQAVGILWFSILEHAHERIKSPEDRYWFHHYILHKSSYPVRILPYIDAPTITVDTQEDLDEVREIYEIYARSQANN